MFAAPFSNPFVPPAGGEDAVAPVVSWWLSGGISAANCLAAYTPKGAASLAASYDNNAAPGNGLADGAYDTAPGVAPSFDAATGWTFNGSSQYLKTGVRLYQPYTVISSYNNAGFSSSDYHFGIVSTSPSTIFYDYQISAGFISSFANGSSRDSFTTVSVTTGIACIAGAKAYWNGADTLLSLDSSWAYDPNPSGGCFIGSRNFSGSPNGYNDCVITAFAIYNTTLTSAQVSAVSAAMMSL